MDTCTACNKPIEKPIKTHFYCPNGSMDICPDCQCYMLQTFLHRVSPEQREEALQTAAYLTNEARNPTPEPPDFPPEYRYFDHEAQADLHGGL